jgi:hypothetical protein
LLCGGTSAAQACTGGSGGRIVSESQRLPVCCTRHVFTVVSFVGIPFVSWMLLLTYFVCICSFGVVLRFVMRVSTNSMYYLYVHQTSPCRAHFACVSSECVETVLGFGCPLCHGPVQLCSHVCHNRVWGNECALNLLGVRLGYCAIWSFSCVCCEYCRPLGVNVWCNYVVLTLMCCFKYVWVR